MPNWRKYPIVLVGYDIRRWEEWGGGSTTMCAYVKKLIFWKNHAAENLGPIHIQYASPWGFLLTWPLCFHIWKQFTMQTPGVSGSERILYFRFGFGRWDPGDSKWVGWEWSLFGHVLFHLGTAFLGGHWD